MTTYNPEATREKLVEAAFYEIWRNGFRSASLDTIFSNAGVTKGAFYHHFKNKKDIGYTVVDEVIRGWIIKWWFDPLQNADDPIDTIIAITHTLQREMPSEVHLFGCPLNNLTQEMSPIDEGFRQRLDAIYQEWRDIIVNALKRGQESGTVRGDIDPHKAAIFITAVYEGGIGVAKNAQKIELFDASLDELIRYLESLRLKAHVSE